MKIIKIITAAVCMMTAFCMAFFAALESGRSWPAVGVALIEVLTAFICIKYMEKVNHEDAG